jgi:hypothetical protein
MIVITFYLNQLFLLYALNESTIILPALNCSDKTKFNIVFGVEIKNKGYHYRCDFSYY